MGFTFNPVRKGKFLFTVSSQLLTVTSVGNTLVEMPNVTPASGQVLMTATGFSESIAWDTIGGAGHPEFGITSTANWGTNHATGAPFYVYLLNGTNAFAGLKLIVSRNPCMTVAPAEGLFWYSDADADTDTQLSVAASWADGTDYSAKPVVCIGSLVMSYATATNTWTPAALEATDGFGKFQEGVQFTMPAGQNGNAAGKYAADNGGTAPAGSSDQAAYWIDHKTGVCTYTGIIFGGDLNGAGAVTLTLFGPYNNTTVGTQTLRSGNGSIKYGGGATTRGVFWLVDADATPTGGFTALGIGDGAGYNNSDVDDNGDLVAWFIPIKAF